jgi:hypothetical protein
MAVKHTKWPYVQIPTLSFPRPPKYTQIGIFGKKIYYLATLITVLLPSPNRSLFPVKSRIIEHFALKMEDGGFPFDLMGS